MVAAAAEVLRTAMATRMSASYPGRTTLRTGNPRGTTKVLLPPRSVFPRICEVPLHLMGGPKDQVLRIHLCMRRRKYTIRAVVVLFTSAVQ
jgi:hypothetical protein